MNLPKMTTSGYLKRSTLITSWIFSYVIIVSIPILISSLLLFRSLEFMREESKMLCQSDLENMGAVMDGYLEELRHIALSLSKNGEALSIIEASEFTPKEHYMLYVLQREMYKYVTTNTNVDNIGLLLMEHDTLLTHRSNTQISIDGDRFLDSRLIQSMEEGAFLQNYYYLPESGSITYILSLPYQHEESYQAYLFVTLNPEICQNICSYQDSHFFHIIFENSDILNSTPGSDQMAEDDLVFHHKSRISAVSYTMVFRSSKFAGRLHTIQFFMVACSIACVLFSILLVYYFTRKHYMPLLALVKKITPDYEERENEYQFLEKHIDSFQKKISTLEEEQIKNHAVMEDIYLVKLLHNAYSPEEYRQIERMPIWSTPPRETRKLNLAILVFTIDISSWKERGGAEENNNLIRFILKNILGNLIAPELGWQSAFLEEKLFLVIHGHHSMLNQACASITSQMPPLLNTFHIQIQIGISIGCRPLNQLHLLYKEALYALEYCLIYNIDYTYYNDSLSGQTASAYDAKHVIEIQRKFQNTVLAQNYDSAIEMLPELFDCNFKDDQHISLLRLNMYSLVNLYRSCLMGLSEKDGFLQSLANQQIASLLDCASLDTLREQLGHCLGALQEYKNSHSPSGQQELIGKIQEYVQIHYSDNSLSAGQIADVFNMPLSTVSKLFKKYTQMGLLDYIHHVRIRQAKKLLQTGKHTVSEVASMTGYLSTSSFIRVFKKYEGISPGALMESK